jgi:hypothetical protein
MENLEQFLVKQAAELEKKKVELAEFENLGKVDGLEPWLIHSKLYGVRHVAFKLIDLEKFTSWAADNCDPVYAIEGKYKSLYPRIPETLDYKDARIVAEGFVKITYSTIMRRFEAKFFKGDYCISFEMSKAYIKDLMPIAVMKQYSDRYYGERKVDGWKKTNIGQRQYLRLSVDKQSADLETLLTLDEFKFYFISTPNE